eukprot:s235_g24.t1
MGQLWGLLPRRWFVTLRLCSALAAARSERFGWQPLGDAEKQGLKRTARTGAAVGGALRASMKHHGLASSLLLLLCTISEGLNVLNGSTAASRRSNHTAEDRAEDARNVTSVESLPSPDAFRSSKIWGPPAWFFLHSVTLALPEEVPKEKQLQLKNLLVALQEVLPCPNCAEHWRQHMEKDPVEPHLAHRKSMVEWMIRMHNQVNLLNKKPIQSKEEVLEEFQLAYDKFGRYGGYEAVLGQRSFGSTWRNSWSLLAVLALLGLWRD